MRTVKGEEDGDCRAPVPSKIQVDKTEVYLGDCLDLIPRLPDSSIDIVVTSPPYWGQRESAGTGTEADPREYLAFLQKVFESIHPKLKDEGIIWINMGDSYNTPVNWGQKDYKYSSLGPDRNGFKPENAAYTKPRYQRKAFIDPEVGWAHVWQPSDATPTAHRQPHGVEIPISGGNSLG